MGLDQILIVLALASLAGFFAFVVASDGRYDPGEPNPGGDPTP